MSRESKFGHPFRLVNIGRDKFCGEAKCSSGDELLAVVCRHLRSRDVWLTSDGQVYAGFRQVGQVEPIGDVAAAALNSWCHDDVADEQEADRGT